METVQEQSRSDFINWRAFPPRILYLLLSLPLGIAYFVFTVVLFAVGVGTLIIGIGIPILLVLFLVSQTFLDLERALGRSLLGLHIPDPAPVSEPAGLLQRLLFRAGRLESWTGLLYLMLKLPLGIASFVLTIVLIVLPAAFACGAVVSLFLTAVPIEMGRSTYYLDPLTGAVLLGLIAGIVGTAGSLVVTGLAKVWEGLNSVMLTADTNWVAPPPAEGRAAVVIS